MAVKKRGKPISAAKVRQVLSEEPYSLDRELQARCPSAGEPLLLESGRVLLRFEDGRGTLYESRADVLQLLAAVEQMAAQGPYDPAKELLPSPSELIASASVLAEQVAHSIGGSDPDSMRALDAWLTSLPKAVRTSPSTVAKLVAFVGECIRAATGGEWFQDPTSSEPLVRGADGRIFQPFGLVYLELTRGDQGSVEGAVAGALGAQRLGAAARKPN